MSYRNLFLFLFYVVSVAVSGKQSPTQIYLDKRNEVISKAEKGSQAEDGMPLEKMEVELNGPLKKMIRNAIGPFNIKGFPKEWEYNIDSLYRDDPGFYALDGMRATSLDGKTQAVVSTVPLLRAWIQSQNDVFQSDNIMSVIKNGRFYTNAFMADAYAYEYSEMLTLTPNKYATIMAILITYGSDYVAPDSPHKIALTIIKGNLVYIITDEIQIPIKVMPVCMAVFEHEVLSGGGEVNPHDQQHQGQYTWVARDEIKNKANDEFLRCFKQHVSSEKYYPALVKQAQAWINKVGGKKKSARSIVEPPHQKRNVEH